MKKILLLFCIFSFCLINLSAQSLEKSVNDAFLISRMVEKFHIQPRPLDDVISSAIYSRLLQSFDDDRIFFMKEDIDKLSAFQFKIDDEIKNKQLTFLQLFATTYKQRLLQADTMVDNICKKPFNFYIKEKISVTEDTSYPSGIAAMHNKLYKFLKLVMLNSLVRSFDIYSPGKLPPKKTIDSLEPALRKKANSSLKRFIKRIIFFI